MKFEHEGGCPESPKGGILCGSMPWSDVVPPYDCVMEHRAGVACAVKRLGHGKGVADRDGTRGVLGQWKSEQMTVR